MFNRTHENTASKSYISHAIPIDDNIHITSVNTSPLIKNVDKLTNQATPNINLGSKASLASSDYRFTTIVADSDSHPERRSIDVNRPTENRYPGNYSLCASEVASTTSSNSRSLSEHEPMLENGHTTGRQSPPPGSKTWFKSLIAGIAIVTGTTALTGTGYYAYLSASNTQDNSIGSLPLLPKGNLPFQSTVMNSTLTNALYDSSQYSTASYSDALNTTQQPFNASTLNEENSDIDPYRHYRNKYNRTTTVSSPSTTAKITTSATTILASSTGTSPHLETLRREAPATQATIDLSLPKKYRHENEINYYIDILNKGHDLHLSDKFSWIQNDFINKNLSDFIKIPPSSSHIEIQKRVNNLFAMVDAFKKYENELVTNSTTKKTLTQCDILNHIMAKKSIAILLSAIRMTINGNEFTFKYHTLYNDRNIYSTEMINAQENSLMKYRTA